MKQTFEIPGRLAALNDYTKSCRGNPFAANKFKRAQETIVFYAIRAAHLSPIHGCVDIHITWIEPNMRRDHDNIAFAKKFILDALVSDGIIKNDGWTYIGDFFDRFFVNKDNPRIIVDLIGRRECDWKEPIIERSPRELHR